MPKVNINILIVTLALLFNPLKLYSSPNQKDYPTIIPFDIELAAAEDQVLSKLNKYPYLCRRFKHPSLNSLTYIACRSNRSDSHPSTFPQKAIFSFHLKRSYSIQYYFSTNSSLSYKEIVDSIKIRYGPPVKSLKEKIFDLDIQKSYFKSDNVHVTIEYFVKGSKTFFSINITDISIFKIVLSLLNSQHKEADQVNIEKSQR
jgi:hypothetical protein